MTYRLLIIYIVPLPILNIKTLTLARSGGAGAGKDELKSPGKAGKGPSTDWLGQAEDPGPAHKDRDSHIDGSVT